MKINPSPLAIFDDEHSAITAALKFWGPLAKKYGSAVTVKPIPRSRPRQYGVYAVLKSGRTG